jgi:hypothetical protein
MRHVYSLPKPLKGPRPAHHIAFVIKLGGIAIDFLALVPPAMLLSGIASLSSSDPITAAAWVVGWTLMGIVAAVCLTALSYWILLLTSHQPRLDSRSQSTRS